MYGDVNFNTKTTMLVANMRKYGLLTRMDIVTVVAVTYTLRTDVTSSCYLKEISATYSIICEPNINSWSLFSVHMCMSVCVSHQRTCNHYQ